MRKAIITFSLLVCLQCAYAQITLDRQVISCLGLNMCDYNCIYATAGQIDYHVGSNGEYDLTAGFEQPEGPMSMTVTIDFSFDECSSSYAASVSYVSECNNSDSLIFIWNGTEGSAEATGLPAAVTLQINSQGGCEYYSVYDLSQMEVENVPCGLEFFSFLSPNDDGDNDLWIISNITQLDFQDNTVQLFNRWGGIVWETKGYDNQSRVWSGQNMHGEPLPDGTYFYFVKTKERTFNGYVELMR
jgi:gliding motility-associated-like protein